MSLLASLTLNFLVISSSLPLPACDGSARYQITKRSIKDYNSFTSRDPLKSDFLELEKRSGTKIFEVILHDCVQTRDRGVPRFLRIFTAEYFIFHSLTQLGLCPLGLFKIHKITILFTLLPVSLNSSVLSKVVICVSNQPQSL